jgi:hypothetical protein
VKRLLVAAALVVALVSGAAAQSAPEPLRLESYGPAVISPNGNAINDVLHLRVSAPEGTLLGLRVYVWGGRLHGWRRLRTGVSSRSPELAWDGTVLGGRALADGSYLVTVCYAKAGSLLPPRGVPRPGAAERSVRQPDWRRTGCLTNPKVVRVERLAAYVDKPRSFSPGDELPLVASADGGQATVKLEHDCTGSETAGAAVPEHAAPGLYHAEVTDPWGDRFEAPVVVRDRRPLDHPRPHTALVVWPYLTWRAYSSYDADLNGIPDSWYQFWRQRRVSFVGPLLRNGVEDDVEAAAAFPRWVCSRSPRTQNVTDVELGRMSPEALSRYSAVVYPGHSEYYERSTYDLLKRYRDGGGNLIILQANPFYRPVRIDRGRNAEVLLDYDAREGRSDFGLAGVGYDGCCFPKARAAPYVAATGRDYERVRWLFRGTGIEPGQAFGVANSESDRVDPGLSPPRHVIAAQAILRGKHGVVHASMTWTRAGRGQVFATGNYTFLRMGRGITYKLLDNVWARLVG